MRPLVTAAAAVFFITGRERAIDARTYATLSSQKAPGSGTGEEEDDDSNDDNNVTPRASLDTPKSLTSEPGREPDNDDEDGDGDGDGGSDVEEDSSGSSVDGQKALDSKEIEASIRRAVDRIWSPQATGQGTAATALFEELRRRTTRSNGTSEWDWLDLTRAPLGRSQTDSDSTDHDGEETKTALDLLRRGLRKARIEMLRAAARKNVEETEREQGLARILPRQDWLNAWSVGDESDSDRDDDDSLYDVRPLLAVSMGITLFLLTRAPKDSYSAELERTVQARANNDDEELVADLLGGDEAATTVDWPVVSDMRSGPRNIVIVTTAALPWMTGTAVNPLLRAVYLAKAGHDVSLVVPWLESPEDQRKVYPKDTVFTSRAEQMDAIMTWAKDQVPDVQFNVRFYEGVYSDEFGSILPLGDLTAMFADDEVRDICVLEEPEHLTWHHTGARWTRIFKFCVGVVHTNYLEYAKKHGVFGPQRALFLNFLNKWVCRSYCHRVIKLSDAVQALPHSVTCNVHGVRDRFLEIGKARRGKPFLNGAYFLGKVLWAKGYAQLVELMEEHYERTEERLCIDFFGAGPDLPDVKKRVRGSYALSSVQVHGVVVDHASEFLQRYKVYVNPSKSDVVCTATAEALAMGKFVICLKHPSNEFFSTFENCLIYRTAEEFSSKLAYALANEPAPLSESELYRLSWEAATERFYDASRVVTPDCPQADTVQDVSSAGVTQPVRPPPGGRVDTALAATHKTICAKLVTPPASAAVRARSRAERRQVDERRRLARRESARQKRESGRLVS